MTPDRAGVRKRVPLAPGCVLPPTPHALPVVPETSFALATQQSAAAADQHIPRLPAQQAQAGDKTQQHGEAQQPVGQPAQGITERVDEGGRCRTGEQPCRRERQQQAGQRRQVHPESHPVQVRHPSFPRVDAEKIAERRLTA